MDMKDHSAGRVGHTDEHGHQGQQQQGYGATGHQGVIGSGGQPHLERTDDYEFGHQGQQHQGHGATGHQGVIGSGGQPQMQHPEKEHGGGGLTSKLNRSGSSSSSEDDGMGGRRKKGIKEKIKEKLPGGNKQEEQGHAAGYGATGGHQQTGYGGTGAHQQPEKEGMMEKIKDKLPGGNH